MSASTTISVRTSEEIKAKFGELATALNCTNIELFERMVNVIGADLINEKAPEYSKTLKDVRASLSTTWTHIMSLCAPAQQAVDKATNGLNEKLQSARATNDTLQKQLDAKTKEVQEQQEKAAGFEEKCKALALAVDTADIAKAHVEALQAKADAYDALAGEYAGAREQHRQEIEEWRQKYQQSQQELENTRRTLAEREAALGRSEKDAANCLEQQKELKSELDECRRLAKEERETAEKNFAAERSRFNCIRSQLGPECARAGATPVTELGPPEL